MLWAPRSHFYHSLRRCQLVLLWSHPVGTIAVACLPPSWGGWINRRLFLFFFSFFFSCCRVVLWVVVESAKHKSWFKRTLPEEKLERPELSWCRAVWRAKEIHPLSTEFHLGKASIAQNCWRRDTYWLLPHESLLSSRNQIAAVIFTSFVLLGKYSTRTVLYLPISKVSSAFLSAPREKSPDSLRTSRAQLF